MLNRIQTLLDRAKKMCIVFLALLMVFQVVEPGLRVLADTDSIPFMDMDADYVDVQTETEDIFGPSLPEDPFGPHIPEVDEWYEFQEAESTELTGEDIIGEIVHLREENVKHFRMSDGSMIAVMYDTEVHFQDEDGYWQDIDNSLTLDVAEDTSARGAEDVFDALEELFEQEYDVTIEDVQAILEYTDIGIEDIVLTTADTLLDIQFNLESGCDETPDFLLEHEGYTVGLSLIGAEEQLAEVVSEEVTPADNSIAAAVQPRNLTSRIIYRDILPGVDLEYVLHGHDIKENIIVNHLLDSHTFFFELDLDGLRPVHNDDGSIFLVSRETGEEVLLIPAPFMWDANDVFSTDVRYEIIPAGYFDRDSELDPADFPEIEDWDYENADEDTRYLFVVIVCEDWMHDSERAFPVTVDPPIVNRWGAGNMSTTYVTRDRPDRLVDTYGQMDLGYSSLGNNWVYLRINELPPLPTGSTVVRADIALGQLPGRTGFDPVSLTSMDIAVFGLSGGEQRPFRNWSRRITWNQRPAYSPIMLDYTAVRNAPNGAFPQWNITGITQDWYDNARNSNYGRSNYGLMFRAVNDADFAVGRARALARFAGFNSNSHVSARPVFILQYRNTIGLPRHLTQASQSLARAGTGHVADYSGQLTVTKPLVGHASSVNPFSLSLIYNSERYNTLFGSERTANNPGTPNARRFDSMRLGHGWKLSAQQTIVEVSFLNPDGTSSPWLVYTSATGTEHYFRRDGDYYRDEDGLGLRIRRSAHEFIMYDDQNSRMIFRHGFLSEMVDRNNNRILFVYNTINPNTQNWHPINGNTNQLRQVIQRNNGASDIVIAQLNYDAGRLTEVIDRAGLRTRFTYTGERLTSIIHPDNTVAHYAYDGPGGRLTAAHHSESGQGARYVWGDVCQQIVEIRTFTTVGTTRTYAATIIFRNGRNPGSTLYRERVPGRNDILEYVLFDNAGRTVNYYITDDTGANVLAASTSRFTRNTGTDRRNNRMAQTASIGVAAMNLLQNAGMENGMAHWTSWGSNVSVSPYARYARTGTHSQQVGTTTDSGFSQAVTLQANTTYTFSAYVNTSEVTQFTATGGIILFFNRSGTTTRQTVPFNIRTEPSVNGGWHRLHVTYRPTTTASYLMGITYRGITGTARADDFQLETGDGPSNVNLVQNSAFQMSNLGNVPQSVNGTAISTGSWTRHGTGQIVTTERRSGTQSLRIDGFPGRREFVYQDIPINLPATETFVLSGWGMADSIPHRGEDLNNDPWFGLYARVFYSDNTEGHSFLHFNTDVRGWQFASAPVVSRHANRANVTITRIRVHAHYNHNANTAFFDNISLVREVAQTMRYDANGNLVGVTESGSNNMPDNIFDSRNNLTRQVTRTHGTIHNTYDDNNNLTRVIRGPNDCVYNHNLMLQMTYDQSGNLTNSTITGSGNAAQLVSSAYFSNAGGLNRNLVTRITDVNGTTQTKDYGGQLHHIMRGIPTSVTDARGNTVSTQICVNTGRPTQIWQTGLVSVAYIYNNRGNMTEITRAGFDSTNVNNANRNRIYQTYRFAYNDFGQMTEVAVGNTHAARRVLKRYEYNADHSLRRRTYGNNHNVSYEYDFLGRTTAIQHRNTATGAVHTTFRYNYTGDGRLASVREYAGTGTGTQTPIRTYEYTYDTKGRLVNFVERGAGGTLRQSGNQTYDDTGRMIYFAYNIPSIPRAYTRRYAHIYEREMGNLAYLWLPNGGAHLYFDYDHLQRLRSRQLRGGVSWETSFAYRIRSGNDSTQQVQWMTHRIGAQTPENINPASANVTLRYQYWYDSIGQITRWRNPVSQRYHNYTYDAQNQLTRELITDLSGFVTQEFNYVYDTYGNIRERTRWNANGSTQTTTFTYGNAQWRDLLTAVNGNTITYDNSGNPTRWHDGSTFTWTRGRQLASIVRPTGARVDFTYDVDGIRQSKVVTAANGTRTIHQFYTQNGKILAETRQNGTTGVITERLEFIYDEAGRPIQLIRNGVVHNYVLNLQGDVQQIRRADTGAVVATYLYNAWGELISSSGTLANVNPLRYRGEFWCSSSGFYYLQTRYYCPAIGRFINADGLLSTGQGFLGFNMFTYVLNNPVNHIDPDGQFARRIASAVRNAVQAVTVRVQAAATRVGQQIAQNVGTQTRNQVSSLPRTIFGVGNAGSVNARTSTTTTTGVSRPVTLFTQNNSVSNRSSVSASSGISAGGFSASASRPLSQAMTASVTINDVTYSATTFTDWSRNRMGAQFSRSTTVQVDSDTTQTFANHLNVEANAAGVVAVCGVACIIVLCVFAPPVGIAAAVIALVGTKALA